METMDKKTLRAALMQQRSDLPSAKVHAASMRACELVRSLDQWRNGREVLLYWPIRGEVDVRPLLAELWQRGSKVLMPRCRPDAAGEMDIACAACESDLTPGKFSIMEPNARTCPPVARCSPDLALIPGVGFDRRGYRLGFGGGYYDRLLTDPDMADTLTVGLCHGFQLVDRLPIEEWDQPVNLICTDEELWRP